MQTRLLLNKTRYKDAVDLISHLILTQPKAVTAVLEKFNLRFEGIPPSNILIKEVVGLLSEDDPRFIDEFSRVLAHHINKKGKKMLSIDQLRKKLRDRDDSFLTGLLGGVAKKLVGGIGGLFKKKRRRSRSSSGASAVQSAQIRRLQSDLRAQMARQAAERRRMREEAERRRREEERKRLERERKAAAEKAASQKKTQTMLMIGGGVALLGMIGFVALKPRPAPYYRNAAPIPQR